METAEIQKKYNQANQLYLNRYYKKAYHVYKEICDSMENNDNHYGAILGILKCIDKISNTLDQWIYSGKLIENFSSFSDNIHDRTFVLKKNPTLFIRKYFEFCANENYDSKLTHKFISTISYHVYFEESNYKNIYEIFSATYKNIQFEYDDIIPQFIRSFPWWGADIKTTENILNEAYQYGLVTRLLQKIIGEPRWGDTMSHKLLYPYPSDSDIEKALVYLKYAAKFSTSYLKKFLYSQSNHQGENWLYDVVCSSNEKLVKQFTKVLEHEKLQHFTLFIRCNSYESYLQEAANQNNDIFVKKTLKSVKKQSDELGVEQRIFNLSALKLSEFYFSKPEMQLMREMGIEEYLMEGNSYEESFAKHGQNVHRKELSDPIVEATRKLQEHYNKQDSRSFIEEKCKEFEIFFHSIMREYISADDLYKFLINNSLFKAASKKDMINYESEKNKSIMVFLEGAEYTLSRIVAPDEFLCEYSNEIKDIAKELGYPKHNKIFDNFTLQDALAYAWTGLLDPVATSHSDKKPDESEILDRKLLLVSDLYEIYKEGSKENDKDPKDPDEMEIDEESIPEKKSTSVICITGVFDRLINRLNHVHDLVNIKVQPKEININSDLVKEKADSLMRDLEELPSMLVSRIYDNFDYYKQNNLSKKFIPLQQYMLGAFKKFFTDHFAYIPELNDKDFTLLEKIIYDLDLLNPIEESINKILHKNSKNDPLKNPYFHSVVAKLVLYKLQDSMENEGFNIFYWNMKIISEIRKSLPRFEEQHSNSKIEEIATILSNEKFLNEDIVDKIKDCDPFKLYEEIALKTLNIAEIDKKTIITFVKQIMKDLSEKLTWDSFDIINFNLITSENQIYEHIKLLNDLFRHSIVENNLFMLKMVVNKFETIYERKAINGEDISNRNPNKYSNKYLKDIAKKEFCHGFKVLHLAAIYLKTEDAFDFLLNLHEFREKIDSLDEQNNTASSIAAFNNNDIAVKKFVEYGADINIPNKHGESAIHKIAANYNFDLLKYLLDHGANPFARDNSGNTFVHSAAYSHRSEENLIKFFQNSIGEEIFKYFEDDITEILGSHQDSSEDLSE